jgi:threonine dehydrogenase-like Zn-dependent dehydrogenase
MTAAAGFAHGSPRGGRGGLRHGGQAGDIRSWGAGSGLPGHAGEGRRHAPGRWEWSPLYFKEICWVGSNAFGIEEVDGQRKHAIAHYLDLVEAGQVDLRPMLTHTFGLQQWRDAFLAIADQGASGAVKVAIDQR